MNRLSPITKWIERLLRKEGKPMKMSWIVEQASKKFPNEPSSKFFNAVNNGCISPTDNPRFIKKPGPYGQTKFGAREK